MFVDAHSHILPSIDDGAPDIQTAIELAKIAVEDGITHVVCTPHIHLGRFDNDLETINRAVDALRHALREEQIPLKIAAAAELRVCPKIIELLKADKVPFLGEWKRRKVLLLEFPTNKIPKGSEKLMMWLLKNGIQPLIAHPERNLVLQANFEMIQRFHEIGCLFQITSSSLEGKFGPNAYKVSELMLTKNLVFMLASDAHNVDYRPPVLSHALKVAKELIGVDKALELVFGHPFAMSRSKFCDYAFDLLH